MPLRLVRRCGASVKALPHTHSLWPGRADMTRISPMNVEGNSTRVCGMNSVAVVATRATLCAASMKHADAHNKAGLGNGLETRARTRPQPLSPLKREQVVTTKFNTHRKISRAIRPLKFPVLPLASAPHTTLTPFQYLPPNSSDSCDRKKADSQRRRARRPSKILGQLQWLP